MRIDTEESVLVGGSAVHTEKGTAITSEGCDQEDTKLRGVQPALHWVPGLASILAPLYIALKLLVSLISSLVACSARIVGDRQTDRLTHRTTTVTLAAHARRELISNSYRMPTRAIS